MVANDLCPLTSKILADFLDIAVNVGRICWKQSGAAALQLVLLLYSSIDLISVVILQEFAPCTSLGAPLSSTSQSYVGHCNLSHSRSVTKESMRVDEKARKY